MKKLFSLIATVLFAGGMMAATTMTCAEARTAALGVSGNNVEYNSGEEIEVTGYVTSIAFEWKDGSMSFWMADDSLETSNILEAYKVAVDSVNAPKVTDKVKVTGKLTKYNSTPEFAAGCTCEILQVGKGKEEVVIEVTNCATAAEAALSVSGNNVEYNGGQSYTITGYVTAIQTAYNATNKNITFWMADTEAGGKVLEAYKCAIENEADAPLVGDKVSVTGKLTKYNTTPEFAEGCTCTILERAAAATNLGEKTIAEFLELKNIKDTCILTGTVSGLPEDKTANAWTYGNFDLVDVENNDTIYVYGLLTPDGKTKQFASMGIENGSVITIAAIYGEHNGKPQAPNAVLVKGGNNSTPDVPEGVLTVAQAMTAAATIAEPTADNKTVEGEAVKVRGYVVYAYPENNGKQSAWLADTKGGKSTLQGAYLQIEEAVVVGDYVELEGTLAKYYKAADNTIVEVINGTMKKVNPLGFENVTMTTEKAQKVIIDGVLYIVRDGKMFDIRGAQVR